MFFEEISVSKELPNGKENDVHFCPFCNQQFTLQLHCHKHINEQMVMEGKPVHCIICNQEFASKCLRKRHMEVVHCSGISDEIPKFNCGICNKGFIQMRALKHHIWKVHKNDDPAVVAACKRELKENTAPQTESPTNEEENPAEGKASEKTVSVRATGVAFVECPTCRKRFKNKGDYDAHQRLHADKAEFCCQFCSQAFQHESERNLHEKTHENSSTPYECFVCHQSFRTKGVLICHQSKHGSGPRYKSRSLSRSSSSAAVSDRSDNDSIKSADPVEPAISRRFDLKECRIVVERMDSVEQAAKTGSGSASVDSSSTARTPTSDTASTSRFNGESYECLECGKRFWVQTQLINHQRKHRMGASPQLEVKTPTKRSSLQAQVVEAKSDSKRKKNDKLDPASASKVDERVCPLCSKLFSTKGNLAEHMNYVHSDDKPFTCPLCPMAFNRKGNYQRHVRICENKAAGSKKRTHLGKGGESDHKRRTL